MNMLVSYNVKLVIGNSLGDYNIYFDEEKESNIAKLKENGSPAVNISLEVMLIGIDVEVPEDTKKILVVGITCSNRVEIPVTYQKPKNTPPNLCFSYQQNGTNKSLNFTPDGTLNGKTKWISDNTQLEWNPFIQLPSGKFGRWQVSINNGNTTLTTNETKDVPDSGWYEVGSQTIQNLKVTTGECIPIPLILTLKSTPNSCFGSTIYDGSIVASATGGAGAPYLYSIDGNKYGSWPEFKNLAPGEVTIFAKDGEGNITKSTTTIGEGNQPFTYKFSVSSNSKEISKSTTERTVKSEFNLNTNPIIQKGDTVKLKIIFKSTQIKYTPGDGTFTETLEVYKNQIKIEPTSVIENEYEQNTDDCSTSKEIVKIKNFLYEIEVSFEDKITGTLNSVLNLTNPAVDTNFCVTKLESETTNSIVITENICSCCKSVGEEKNIILSNFIQATKTQNNCDELKLSLTNYNLTYSSALTVGELLSNNVNITDYYINWYKDGNNQQPAFTSGKGKKYFLQNLYEHTQPITGNSAIPLEEGVYIPVVQKVTINDKEYDLSSYLNCLPSTIIVALGCDNSNQTERYAYSVVYDTITNTPQSVSTTFKLKSGVKYIPIWFRPQNIPDTLTVNLYNKTYGMDKPITLIKIKGGQNNTDEVQYNPFDGDIVTRLYDLYFILNLSKFTISDDDYLIFKIDPGGSQTEWFLKWKCLSDITCGECLFDDTINKKISKRTIVIYSDYPYYNWKDEGLRCDTSLNIYSVCDENLLRAESFDYLYYNRNLASLNNVRWSFKNNVISNYTPTFYSPENGFKGCESKTYGQYETCKNGNLTLTRNTSSFTFTSTQPNVLSDIFDGLQQKVTQALQQLNTDKTKPDAYGILRFFFVTNSACSQSGGGGENSSPNLNAIEIQIPHKLFVSIGTNSINFTLPPAFTEQYVQDVYLQDLPKTCEACFTKVSGDTYFAFKNLESWTVGVTRNFTAYLVKLDFKISFQDEGVDFTPPNFGISGEYSYDLVGYQKTTVPYVMNNNNRQILQEYVAENCKEVNQKLSNVGNYNFTFYNAQMINKNTFDIYRVPLINGRWNGFPNPPVALGERILTVQRIFNNNTFVNNGTYVFTNENPNYVTD